MNVSSVERKKIVLLYDKECPVCKNYWQMIRIRESVADLVLIDAREESQLKEEATAAGYDLDQGIVLKMDNQLYFGADVVHILSLMSSRNGFLNRLNYWCFRSKYFSKVSYPFLRFCRNLLLKILFKNKIDNLKG